MTLSDAELDRKRLSLGAHHSQTAPLIELMGEPLYREWNRVETFRNATADDFTEAVDHLTHLIPT